MGFWAKRRRLGFMQGCGSKTGLRTVASSGIGMARRAKGAAHSSWVGGLSVTSVRVHGPHAPLLSLPRQRPDTAPTGRLLCARRWVWLCVTDDLQLLPAQKRRALLPFSLLPSPSLFLGGGGGGTQEEENPKVIGGRAVGAWSWGIGAWSRMGKGKKRP